MDHDCGSDMLMIYTHYRIMWKGEAFSVRNQGVGCALAWVTIARDSESDYPFYNVVQFRRIRAGH